jgi:hypothetical protein
MTLGRWPVLDLPVLLFKLINNGAGNLMLLLLGQRSAHAANQTEPLAQAHYDGQPEILCLRPHRGRIGTKRERSQGPTGRARNGTVSTATPGRQHEAAVVHLTPGKLNAVRAAFKAGVKPSQIARQFCLSQSDMQQALDGTQGDSDLAKGKPPRACPCFATA